MVRLEPTNLANIDFGGFWNFAFMSESCGWEDAVTPFRKTKLDEFLQYFAEYLREHSYLSLDPDSININIPGLSYQELKYLDKELKDIIKESRHYR